jgi:DNA-binding transcriptional LysR family regulator
MNDRLSSLRLFARVARTGSFSRAALEMGLTQPSASRIIATLEREVGATLFTRTTRAVSLTQTGADYLTRIEIILAALDEADVAARGTGEIRGTLRVASTTSFAVREVIPRLPIFMALHPELHIDLLLSDRREDLIAESVDVALRFGVLPDSNATARLLGLTPRVLAAAPSYLKRVGMPQVPEDLADHPVIVGPAGVGPTGWTFQRDGKTTSVRVEGRLSLSVNEGAIAAAVAGIGIVSTGVWGCRAELENGALVQVLPEWRLQPIEAHAVFAAGRAAKPAARAFTDFLTQAIME